jgi:hypothetical protein
MKEEENVKFIRKFRDSHKAFLGLRSSNSHGSYQGFEEYSGRGATLLSPRVRTNGAVEVLWRFYNFYWLPIPKKKKPKRSRSSTCLHRSFKKHRVFEPMRKWLKIKAMRY